MQGKTPSLVTLVVELPDRVFTKGEVRDRLKTISARKAAGADGVHPAIVKLLPMVLVKPFTHIFNTLLDEG